MLKRNCFYFYADRPCSFHKKKRVICETCSFYKPSGIKILIIKLGALGDVLRTTSIINPLIQKYSKNKHKPLIYWVTYEKSVSLLENIPQIKEVLPYNSITIARLMLDKFDVMLNLDLSQDALVLSQTVNAVEKKGFGLDSKNCPSYINHEAREWFEMSHNDKLKKLNKKTYQEHMLKIAGLKSKKSDYKIIINLNKEEIEFSRKFLEKLKLTKKNSLIIGLNTGGGEVWEKKEWPADSTIALIKSLKTIKIRSQKPVILLFGGKKEAKRNKYIISKAGKNAIDTGIKNSLKEFFALLNICDIVIATDTLALHASLALGKKTIALFGPTSPAEIEMYGLGKKIIAPVNCTVCYKRRCNNKPDCMTSISPEIVYKTILQLKNP